MIQLLEGSLSKLGSLAIELLSPDKNNLPSKQTISLHIPTLTESSNFTSPSRDENQRNTPMMSGFDPENNKSYVEGLSLEDLGGNFEVRDEIEGLIEILSHADHFRKYDAQPPRGILLWGPPGTGKTLAAKIIASQLGINFYEFSSADLMNVFVGESPKIVQSIFRDTKKPCIIFLDEIDAILTSRKDSLGGKVDTEVRQEFLRGLDGLASVPGVTLIGATNNREGIDSAVLRPGRIDRQIYVGLPNEEARSQILGIHLQKALATGRQNEVNIFSRDIEEHLQTLSQAMDGFSGADIAEVVRRSVLFVARRTLKDPVYVIDVAQMQHIVEQIRTEKAEQKHRQVGFTSNNY